VLCIFLPLFVSSIQVVVLVVLRPLRGELQRHALVGELTEPDAGRDSEGVLEAAPFSPALRVALRIRRLEDPDQPRPA
jgi:hypothetical protein